MLSSPDMLLNLLFLLLYKSRFIIFLLKLKKLFVSAFISMELSWIETGPPLSTL